MVNFEKSNVFDEVTSTLSSYTLSAQLSFNSQPSMTGLKNAVNYYANQGSQIYPLITKGVNVQPINATSIIQTITIQSSNKIFYL